MYKAKPRKADLFLVSMGLFAFLFTIALIAMATRPQYCVGRIDPIRPGEISSEVSQSLCFDNLADAITYGTGGAIQLPPDTPRTKILEALSRSGK